MACNVVILFYPRDIAHDNPEVIGYVKMPVHLSDKPTEKWYTLISLGKKRGDKSKRSFFGGDDEKILRSKMAKWPFQVPVPEQGPLLPVAHNFVEKNVFGNCAVCKTSAVGSHLVCTVCGVTCHVKCRETAANICGGVGLLRLRLTHTV